MAVLSGVFVALTAVSPRSAVAAVNPVVNVALAPESATQNSGAFTTSIDLVVPPFHGVEPKLSLVYNSSAGNGHYGVGWQLAGESRITRMSPGHGVAAYEGDDEFQLDGEPLVASTKLGGTHATKRQSFRRITYLDTSQWLVRDPDGGQWSYGLGLTAPGGPGPVRWMLTQHGDRHGNVVKYNYWCDGTSDCYLDTITYNQAVIYFYRGDRLDVLTRAAGSSLLTTRYRVKTIDVVVAGVRARTYALSYETAPLTGQSRLTSVRQFGADAVIEGSYDVVSGSAFPATVIGWQNGADWQPGDRKISTCPDPSTVTFGDVDGDHRADFVCHYTETVAGKAVERWRVESRDGSFPTRGDTFLTCSTNPAQSTVYAADVNGDGRDDIVCLNISTRVTTLALATGAGQFSAVSGAVTVGGANICAAGGVPLAGDFTRDGNTDLACWTPTGEQGAVRVAVSAGNGTFTGNAAWGHCLGTTGSWAVFPDDVNGDGLTDLLCLDYTTGTGRQLVSTGAALPSTSPEDPAMRPNADCANLTFLQVTIADFNGDGASDIACYRKDRRTVSVALALGRRGGFSTPTVWTGMTCSSTERFRVGDFTGDGLADALCHSSPHNRVRMAVSNGSTGFINPTTWTPDWPRWCYGSTKQFFTFDQNGDGRTDLGCWDDVNVFSVYRAAGYDHPDLVTRVQNPTGGVTTVEYGWKSATFGPIGFRPAAVTRTTVSDGLGTTTNITFDYSEGQWDPVERRFLGFGQVVASNANGGSTLTRFATVANQAANRVTSVQRRGRYGEVLSTTDRTYTETSDAGVYTSLPATVVTATCASATACQSAKTSYLSYDTYGNATEVVDWGDTAVTGDETYTRSTYGYVTNDYVVNQIDTVSVYAGTDGAGTRLAYSSYGYSPTGRDQTSVSRCCRPDNGASVTRTATYYTTGELKSSTDESNRTTSYTYDSTYQVYPAKTCDGTLCTTDTWDPVLGVRKSTVDANNTTASWDYDKLGRQIAWHRNDGGATSISYESWGTPGQQRIHTSEPDGSADGLWTDVYLDGLGRTWKTVAEPNIVTRTVYNTAGLVAGQTRPYNDGGSFYYTGYVYDELGRLTTLTNTDETVETTTWSYLIADDNDYRGGRITSLRCDELNRCTRYGYNPRGDVAVTSQWSGYGMTGTEYRSRASYDRLGRLTGLSDSLGQTILAQQWDTLGRRTSVTTADSGTWTYRYNDAGQVISQTDARGVTTDLVYDSHGRLYTRSVGGAELAIYTYDEAGHGYGAGHLTSLSDTSGQTEFAYDAMGRANAYQFRPAAGGQYRIERTWDKLGRLESVTYPDAEKVVYGYASNGCLTTVGSYVTGASCNPSGTLSTRTLGSGVIQKFNFSEARLWLDTSSVVNTSGATIFAETYGHNNAGQVTSKTSTDPADQWTYGYDPMGRLTSATNTSNSAYSASYAVDQVGRVTAVNGTQFRYPATGSAHPHAPNTIAGVTQTYDAAGNLTNDGRYGYTYDKLGRISSVTNLLSPSSRSSYSYDDLGSLVKMDGADLVGVDHQVLFQHTATGDTKFVYYGSERIARKKAGVVSYYLTDHLGTGGHIIDATGSGSFVKQSIRSPYGVVQRSSATIADPFGLSGEPVDVLGNQPLGGRLLVPGRAAFSSPDTSGHLSVADPASLNLYAYANSDPANLVDHTGQYPVPVVGGKGTGAGGGPAGGGSGGGQNLGKLAYDVDTGDDGSVKDVRLGWEMKAGPFSVKVMEGSLTTDGKHPSVEISFSIKKVFSASVTRDVYYRRDDAGNSYLGTQATLKAKLFGYSQQWTMRTDETQLTVGWDLATGSPFGSPSTGWDTNIDHGYVPGLVDAANAIGWPLGSTYELGGMSPYDISLYPGLVSPYVADPLSEVPGLAEAAANDPWFNGSIFDSYTDRAWSWDSFWDDLFSW